MDSPAVTATDAASPSSHRHADRDNSTLKVRRPPSEVIRTSSTTDGPVVRGRAVARDDAEGPTDRRPDSLEELDERRVGADEPPRRVVNELPAREVGGKVTHLARQTPKVVRTDALTARRRCVSMRLSMKPPTTG